MIINSNLINLSISPKLIIIIASVLITALIILCIFSKISRLIVGILISCVVIVSGVFSAYFDIRYFVSKGETYGEAIEGEHNITKVVYDGFYSFDYMTFGFASTKKENEYSCKNKFNKTIDISSKEYCLNINGISLKTTDIATDYIKSEYEYIFYSSDGTKLLTDKLYISFFSYENSMQIEIKTKGGDTAVKYWRYYLAKNKFVLSLDKENIMPDNKTLDVDIPTEEPKKITLRVQFENDVEAKYKKACGVKFTTTDPEKKPKVYVNLTCTSMKVSLIDSWLDFSSTTRIYEFNVPTNLYALTVQSHIGLLYSCSINGEQKDSSLKIVNCMNDEKSHIIEIIVKFDPMYE